jgi:hypothetical protein
VLAAGRSKPGSPPVQAREPGHIDMLNWRLHSKLTHT